MDPPPPGQFSSLDFFVKKCRRDIQKLKFKRNTKISNLSTEEWAALKSLSKRKDVVIKAADKGGAVVVWRTDLYRQEVFGNFSTPLFMPKLTKISLQPTKKPSKKIIQDLIDKQELPVTAKNLIVTTPRTSRIYCTKQSWPTNCFCL